MARILSRPMFRKGGSTNKGIMDGLVDRKGYAQGPSWDEVMTKNPNIAEAYGAFGAIDAPRDTSLSEMLIGGGLNLVSGKGAGEGLMANVARSYKGPSEEFFKQRRTASDYDRKLKQAAVQSGLEQKWTLEQIRAKSSPDTALYNVYLTQGVEQGMSGSEAQRFATYHTSTKEALQKKVGHELVAGIIEQDLNSLTDKQRKKFLSKNKKNIGKYFYDPYDGKIKLLTEENGQLGFVPFDSVDSIDLSALPAGVSTETSTPFADAQAFREQEKEQAMLVGDVTDQDIMDLSQRFP